MARRASLPPLAVTRHAAALYTVCRPCCVRSYIIPQYPTVVPFATRYYPASMGPITDIPPTGNAPVLLTRADLLKIIPEWARV